MENNIYTPEDIVRFQAEHHEIIPTEHFTTLEDYCLYLIHLKAYEDASTLAEDKIVLDIGCNNGYGTSIIAKKATKTIGIDVSPKAIEQAMHNYGSDTLTFIVTDGKSIELSDASCDLVTCFQVIEHLGEYDNFMREIKRVLKPHGQVIFTTPNARLRLNPGMRPWNQFHVKEFTHAELKELLEKYFSNVCVEGLTSDKEIALIEKNRLEKSKQAQREGQQLKYKIRKYIKKLLPTSLLQKIKKQNTSNEVLQNSTIAQKFSTSDLYYSEDNLNEAIDFRAICNKN